MKKKNIIIYLIVLTITICNACPRLMISAKKETETKIFPERDMKLEHYKYVTDVPEIIFTTTAEENGLGNTCYCLEGTVVGVYKSGAKAMKAIGKKEAAKKVEDTPAMKTIVLDTKYGRVMIYDIYSYLVSNMKVLLDDASIKELKKEYKYFTKYKDYPEKGSKVKILAVYSGYSSVADMPSFYYGINKYIINTKSDNASSSNKSVKTSQYTYGNIKMEVPEEWGKAYTKEDFSYFYPQTNSMVMITKYDFGIYNLDNYTANEIETAMAYTFDNYKLSASKSYYYKDKAIKNYYVYSFTMNVNNEKCKCRLTIFEYNGEVYLIYMVNNKKIDNMDNLFDVYSDLIKSIKPKK